MLPIWRSRVDQRASTVVRCRAWRQQRASTSKGRELCCGRSRCSRLRYAQSLLRVQVGAAFAGEVIGPPGSIGNPGTPKDTTHASSICSFSGLNDFVNGPTDFIVQSFGQDVRLGHPSPIGGITDPTVANPGDFCGHDSNPDRT